MLAPDDAVRGDRPRLTSILPHGRTDPRFSGSGDRLVIASPLEVS